MQQAGINAIYLVTTETYDKEKFLEMGAAVKREVGDIPLVANVPDFDYDYAVELKKTGFTGCYHVIRFDEGIYTRARSRTATRPCARQRRRGLRSATASIPSVRSTPLTKSRTLS